MPKERDPRRKEAFELYSQSKGSAKLKDIAEQLGVAEGTVRGWKNKDSWEAKLNGTFQKNKWNVPNRRGGQPGNKNAIGNKGGGAPVGNQNSIKHGLFSKYLPKETLEIVYQLQDTSPIDLIWMNIELQFAQIIRSMQIMHVENKDDMTKELKRQKKTDTGWEKEYELQFAWDKHASFLTAVSRAMGTLNGLVKQFDEMAKGDDERRLKLEHMQISIAKSKAELAQINGDTEGNAHEQVNSYVEALNSQVEDVFADEVLEDEEA